MDDQEIKNRRNRFYYACRVGKVDVPDTCEKCGVKPEKIKNKRQIQGHHHKGYEDDFLFDVVWLCVKCHQIEHGRVHEIAKIRWANVLKCPQNHDDFGINNRGHRFCKTCARNQKRLSRVK